MNAVAPKPKRWSVRKDDHLAAIAAHREALVAQGKKLDAATELYYATAAERDVLAGRVFPSIVVTALLIAGGVCIGFVLGLAL